MIVKFRPLSALLCTTLAIFGPTTGYATSEPATAILQNVTISATASGAWVENLSRTSNLLDARDASLYQASVVAASSRELSRNWILQTDLEAEMHVVPKYDHNNFATVGPRIGVQRKFGLGPMATVLRFDVAYLYTAARINENDGGTLSGRINVSKRLLSNLRIGATSEWLDHYAKNAAYDIQQNTLSADVSWDFLPAWRLDASAGRISGRIVANAAPATWNKATTGALGPTIFNYYTSIPSAVTNSYGTGWVAYNVEADVDLWSASLIHALSDQTSFNFQFSSAYVTNLADIRYLTKSWSVGVAHRF